MSSSLLKSANSMRIRAFSAELTRGLGVVSTKFVQEIIVGIHHAQSLHLTDIARSLSEDVALKATIKRLSRHLAGQGMTEFITTALLELATREVIEDIILVVSCRALQKPFATQMEYVRGDGDSSDEGGYFVCDISAFDPALPDQYVPILSRLWSRHAPDYQSDESEILAAMSQVNSATGGRGIFYCARSKIGTLTPWWLSKVPDLRSVFIIDNHDKKVMLDGRLWSLSDLASKIELSYGRIIFKMVNAPFSSRIAGTQEGQQAELSILERFGSLAVELDNGKRATFVLERKTSRHDLTPVDDFYLATGAPTATRNQLTTLLDNYYKSIEIDKAANNHKIRFNPSDVRVLSYGRLQLLNVLMQAVTYYEAYVEKAFPLESHGVSSEPHEGDHSRDFRSWNDHISAGSGS
jgi:hypothetical protein